MFVFVLNFSQWNDSKIKFERSFKLTSITIRITLKTILSITANNKAIKWITRTVLSSWILTFGKIVKILLDYIICIQYLLFSSFFLWSFSFFFSLFMDFFAYCFCWRLTCSMFSSSVSIQREQSKENFIKASNLKSLSQ